MARQPRIDFPGAVHHVMNRGANHQDIFGNDLDRQLLLSIWEKAVDRFGVEVICYCWMGNHFHILVRCPEAQLSKTMQFVGRSYTQQFNHHHERDGALYRGRFHSVLIDDQFHFDNVTRYIHLNPLRAGLCDVASLDYYRWGTYANYVTSLTPPGWIDVATGLQNFKDPDDYRSFVERSEPDAALERFYARPLAAGRVLGSQSFLKRIAEEHGSEIAESLTAGIPQVSLAQLDQAVVAASGESVELLRTSLRSNFARQAAVLLAIELCDASVAELVDHFKFPSVTAATSAIARYKSNDEAKVWRIYTTAQAALRDIQGLTPDVT